LFFAIILIRKFLEENFYPATISKWKISPDLRALSVTGDYLGRSSFCQWYGCPVAILLHIQRCI